MLKLNKILQIKTIVLCSSILFSVGLFAQSEKTSEKSTIVMTKSELSSFLTKVADARRSQLIERENKELKQYLQELRLKYQQVSGQQYIGTGITDNSQIINELRYLSQRIENLESNTNSPNRARDNSTIILSRNGTTPYMQNDRNTTSLTAVSSANTKRINELQSKIDSIKKVEANRNSFAKNKSYADTLKFMNRNLSDVRRQMQILESKLMTKDKKPVKTNDSKGNKTYFKQQVYFDNNSDSMQEEYLKNVQDLTQILIDYPEAKILLEGWASPLGKSEYNKLLSMRRAESVKKAFVNNRIDPSRIITAFKGEDKSSSEQNARRVDMSIVIRNK